MPLNCALHNFLIDLKSPEYIHEIEGFIHEEEDEEEEDNGTPTKNANDIRNRLMEWMLTPDAGEVNFQYAAIA